MRVASLFDVRGKILAGLAIGLIAWLIVLLLAQGGLLESFELKAYDGLCRSQLAWTKPPVDIVLVAVDQGSLEAAAKADITWPWPRQMYAPILDFLSRAGARAVAFDILYTEPSSYGVEDDELLSEAVAKNGRVQLPVFLRREGLPAAGEEVVLAKASLNVSGTPPHPAASAGSLLIPIPPLTAAARGFGNVQIAPDADGVYRKMPLVFPYRGRWLPAIGLSVYRQLQGTPALAWQKGGLGIGERHTPLDRAGNFLLTYYQPGKEYKHYSAFNVIASALALQEGRTPLYPLKDFRDKVVFIGFTAPGLFDLKSTPVSAVYPGMAIHATLVANLLQQDFRTRISRPALLLLSALAALAVGVAVMLAAGYGQLLLTALLATGGLLALVLLTFRGQLWVDAVMLSCATGLSFALTAAFSYATEGRQKRQLKQTFSHYMSDVLIQDILRHPAKLRLGGERRILTVFFSDLAGFTTISEKLSPEEIVQLLNTYLSAMTDIILDSGGIIDKYEGDAIMAFWGAPLPQEDHALRACLAALDNQRRLVELRAEFIARGLPPIYARIGVNTGEMIIGNMGSSKRFDFTVIGDAVNLASRLEGAGKEYGVAITISEETYVRVCEHVETRELDLIAVKGKEKPVRIYELLARAGGLDALQRQTLSFFAEGLAHYRRQAWQEAEICFRRALDTNPSDGPSQTFLRRCELFRTSPPPPDWDGVYRFSTK